MYAGDVGKRLRNLYPARQHGDVSNEADIAHELIALAPGITAEHLQFSLIWSEAEDRVQRCGLACAVRADHPENTSLFHTQINPVQSDGCAERLTQATGFYACHGFRGPPLSLYLYLWLFSLYLHLWLSISNGGRCRHSAVLPQSGRAAECWRRSWAILRQETSAVPP